MNAKDKKNAVPNEALPQFMQVQLSIINDLQERLDGLTKNFKTEMACKNQVYSFILQNNHFDEYVKFNKANPVQY